MECAALETLHYAERGKMGILLNNKRSITTLKNIYADDPKPVYEVMGNKYQVIYDRMFDNKKFRQATGA